MIFVHVILNTSIRRFLCDISKYPLFITVEAIQVISRLLMLLKRKLLLINMVL